MNNPKVFLSHASEDKERFVNNFAIKLRENGVDAWLDKWEMLPGESLVDKIFEEGLKNAQAVIIIVSNNSINKPWVKEELNSSIVARIEKGTKIIPVVIDSCDVPESLKTTVWQAIGDLSNYNDAFERILASIFNQSLKPPLGSPPDYTSTFIEKIKGLEPTDNIVLKQSCEHLLEKPDDIIEPNDLFGSESSCDIPKKEVQDSIDILEGEGYLRVSRSFGGGPEHWGCHFRVTLFGFEQYCKTYMKDYGKIVDKCAGLIVNNEAKTNYDLREKLSIPLMVSNHIIRVLENSEYIKISDNVGEQISIWDISPKLKRALS